MFHRSEKAGSKSLPQHPILFPHDRIQFALLIVRQRRHLVIAQQAVGFGDGCAVL
jgi:hypothetical protein